LKINKSVFLLIICFTLQGCKQGMFTKYSAVPFAPRDGGVKSILSKGQIVSIQDKTNTVSVYLKYGLITEGVAGDFYIALVNHTSESITFNPYDISISVSNDIGMTQVFPYTRREFLQKIKTKYDNQAALAILLGALSAASAQYTASTTYYSGTVSAYVPSNTYGGFYYPGGTVHGSYSGYSYNPAAGWAAAEIQNLKTNNAVANIRQQRDNEMSLYDNALLSQRPIEPNATYAGLVVSKENLNIKNPKELTINIKFGGEDYTFKYKISKNNL